MSTLSGLGWARKRAPYQENISTLWQIGGYVVTDLLSRNTGNVEEQDARTIICWNGSRSYEVVLHPIASMMVADSWNARSCTILKRFGTIGDSFIWRNRLEIDISDRYNYSCKNCNHLSPYFKENRYSFEEWKKDIAIAEQSIRAEIFNLIGGEPFLLANLEDYINVLRSSPICNRIGIWTNGALLPKIKDFSAFLDVDEIVISYYPSVNTKELENWLAAYHNKFPCRFDVNRVEIFHVFLRENGHGEQKTADIWKQCTEKRDCHTIYKERYYLCSTSNKFKYLLREKYHVTEDLEDGFPLAQLNNLQEYVDAHTQQTPFKTCSYCNFRTGAVKPHSQGIYEKIL
jgi:hypothetical protein